MLLIVDLQGKSYAPNRRSKNYKSHVATIVGIDAGIHPKIGHGLGKGNNTTPY
ncbi:hypothetical protein [Paenibacillus paridis]|uniref:hypothetical protein n=1 Tax=Paenibacillus paridis TaxID=2583376 RepID=UPI001391B104|nr:hypothetical protein [Paenibacillus paridis]